MTKYLLCDSICCLTVLYDSICCVNICTCLMYYSPQDPGSSLWRPEGPALSIRAMQFTVQSALQALQSRKLPNNCQRSVSRQCRLLPLVNWDVFNGFIYIRNLCVWVPGSPDWPCFGMFSVDVCLIEVLSMKCSAHRSKFRIFLINIRYSSSSCSPSSSY